MTLQALELGVSRSMSPMPWKHSQMGRKLGSLSLKGRPKCAKHGLFRWKYGHLQPKIASYTNLSKGFGRSQAQSAFGQWTGDCGTTSRLSRLVNVYSPPWKHSQMGRKLGSQECKRAPPNCLSTRLKGRPKRAKHGLFRLKYGHLQPKIASYTHLSKGFGRSQAQSAFGQWTRDCGTRLGGPLHV